MQKKLYLLPTRPCSKNTNNFSLGNNVSVGFVSQKFAVLAFVVFDWITILTLETSDVKVIPQYCNAHPYCARFFASLGRAN